MKLELKHLAPYLPYGLQIFDTSQEECIFCLNEWLFREKQFVKPFFKNHLEQFLNDDSLKPILRPLSDLTKEIEVNGEKIVPFKWFNFINSDIDFETQIIALSNNLKWLDSTYYGIIEKLFEWHFDVFGLIPLNLAIDVNTL